MKFTNKELKELLDIVEARDKMPNGDYQGAIEAFSLIHHLDDEKVLKYADRIYRDIRRKKRMLIYVMKHRGLYEPVVDVDMSRGAPWLKVPHWETARMIRAQEEGEKYLRVGAILAPIHYDVYRVMRHKLRDLVVKCNGAKEELLKMNPLENVSKDTVEFMADNADILQWAGASWLVEGEDGYLQPIDEDEAREIMEAWDEEHADDYPDDEDEYDEDDEYDEYDEDDEYEDEDPEDEDYDDEEDDDDDEGRFLRDVLSGPYGRRR